MKRKIALLISRILVFYYRLRYFGRVKFGKNIIVNHKFKLSGPGTLLVGDNVNLWAHCEPNTFNFYDRQAFIKIGSGSRINGVSCHCANSIEFGTNCLISNCTLMDTDFHSFESKKHILYGNQIIKPIQIATGVWLAGQSVVLKGCKIGEHSVVGFRSVVAKNVPANVVVAGNPAKIIRGVN